MTSMVGLEALPRCRFPECDTSDMHARRELCVESAVSRVEGGDDHYSKPARPTHWTRVVTSRQRMDVRLSIKARRVPGPRRPAATNSASRLRF